MLMASARKRPMSAEEFRSALATLSTDAEGFALSFGMSVAQVNAWLREGVPSRLAADRIAVMVEREDEVCGVAEPKMSLEEFRQIVEDSGLTPTDFAAVTGISNTSQWLLSGVPSYASQFVRDALAERQDSGEGPMSAEEFRSALSDSGLTLAGLARATGVAVRTTHAWRERGVVRQRAPQVRHVLSHPELFPQAARDYRRVDAELWEMMTRGWDDDDVAERVGGGVSAADVSRWLRTGVPNAHARRVIEAMSGEREA